MTYSDPNCDFQCVCGTDVYLTADYKFFVDDEGTNFCCDCGEELTKGRSRALFLMRGEVVAFHYPVGKGYVYVEHRDEWQDLPQGQAARSFETLKDRIVQALKEEMGHG